MWWLFGGGALVLGGAALTLRAASRARTVPGGAPVGIMVGLGVSVVFWGLVAVVVGLFSVGR